MKISKFVHSCLLVEEQNISILIDPGSYTYQEKALNPSLLNKLDFLLITHEHQDHMYLPLIKEIIKKFPHIILISNQQVADVLDKEGLKVQIHGNEVIKLREEQHEKLLDIPLPQNTLFTLFNKVTHPGDSLQFHSTSEILALPIQAPWGSFVAAVEKAVSVKPKIVIPIHDWHWRDEAREALYERAKKYLEKFGIKFFGEEKGLVYKEKV